MQYNSVPKSCDLDHIPSKLIIECLDSILSYVTDMLQKSFKTFDDILALFSLQRLNFLFDHCTYVHGLSLLLIIDHLS